MENLLKICLFLTCKKYSYKLFVSYEIRASTVLFKSFLLLWEEMITEKKKSDLRRSRGFRNTIRFLDQLAMLNDGDKLEMVISLINVSY